MKLQIDNAYFELQNLVDGYVYSIAQINWWLLKYDELYKLALKNSSFKKLELQSFIKFYDELDQATKLHKLEQKCYMAYDEYTFLLCVNEDLRDWVIKHYDVYEKVGTYFYSYLSYNSKDDKNLHISEVPDESFGVAVREEDFKSAIRFYDVYYDLYNNQKLYPEKLKEWDEIFAKIQLPKEDL